MLRNGVALVVGVLLVLAGTLDLLWEEVPALQWLLAKAVILALAGMLLLGVFLIVNGITMARREGRSLGNLLSLAAGLGIFVAPPAVISLLNAGTGLAVVAVPLTVLIVFGVGYLALVFLIFLTYAVIYGRTRHKTRPAAVVVLGSQLIEGRVPPLLASRLDRALEIYRQTQDPKPLSEVPPSCAVSWCGGARADGHPRCGCPRDGWEPQEGTTDGAEAASAADQTASAPADRGSEISSAAPRRPSKGARPAERLHGCP